MSFVGTRPEATKYVKEYSREMRATLLLPAGITSEASIRYKDEAKFVLWIKGVGRMDGLHRNMDCKSAEVVVSGLCV